MPVWNCQAISEKTTSRTANLNDLLIHAKSQFPCTNFELDSFFCYSMGRTIDLQKSSLTLNLLHLGTTMLHYYDVALGSIGGV